MKIVEKPWGREIWLAHTDRYAFKIIEINKGTRSSLQYHVRKHEHIYVERGVLQMEWENDEGRMETRVLNPGDVIGYRLDVLRVLVEAGRLDDAAALAENFRIMADPGTSPWFAGARDFSLGMVAMARGNHSEGIALLEEAARLIPATRWFTAHFVLARRPKRTPGDRGGPPLGAADRR